MFFQCDLNLEYKIYFYKLIMQIFSIDMQLRASIKLLIKINNHKLNKLKVTYLYR